MRKAMRRPALLWVRVETLAPEGLEAAFWASARGVRWARVEEEGAWWVLASWASGEAAREGWESFVTGASWRGLCGGVASQPQVHIVAWDERPCVPWDGPGCMFEVTADATVQTREDRRAGGRPESGLVAFEALPAIPGVVLPVIGHPGRFVGWSSALPAALESALGPWVEPPRCWSARICGA